MEINQSQGITLYAFLEAVAQQTAPLPEDLKQQMSQAGEIFTTDINTAINQLANLAQHPSLQPIYESTRQQIQPDYQPQELNEYLHIPKKISLPKGTLENTQSSLRSPAKIKPSQESSKWWAIFIPFIKSNSRLN